MTNKLTEYISNEQSLKDLPFKSFPIQFAEQAGLYKSYIHMNNGGYDYESILLRRYAKIPDLNMFVTNFVILTQIESNYLITNSKYSNKITNILNLDRLNLAIKAILTYHDNNFNESVPVYNFWPQKLLPNSKYYQAYPINLIEPLNEFGSMEKYIEELLKFLKLENLLEKVEDLIESFQFLAQAFHIPADYDDTSCNLALGSMLFKYLNNNQELINLWKSKNVDYDSLFKIYERFAYHLIVNNNHNNNHNNNQLEHQEEHQEEHQKVNNEQHQNIIDPRSYFIFHKFFENNLNIKLPMTWLMDIKQDRDRFPAVAQPFNVNNVDLSVLTNFIFGVSAHTLNGNELLLDSHPIIEQMLLNASKIIEYSIMNEIESKRPDLSLVYYPSVYDFYWFISRTSFLLKNSNTKSRILLEISKIFDNILIKYITNNLLNLSKKNEKNEIYWDDFLGDFKEKELGEDRLFSTSLALSTLLDTWTNLENNRRVWNPSIPLHVKNLIENGILYLQENLFSFWSIYENAFFSGSVKGSNDYPFYYPMNYCEFLNGTILKPIDPNMITDDLIVGMEGLISPQQYDLYLKQLWFNESVPTKFNGFEKETFPFWSSPALTYSITQLVFSKYLSLN
ncbi:predicted protein [Naegleria gruberi]|uniref:Predicted protein n=1 Tax=Naegleria gruberi TaxID=5762 RepID=D2VQB9_NAEGR|nr:uncharacterized protein NAEGRDRAFT_71171 [Naegleria gruberi]EFC40845.1 predicted protein [Naegleria gruberi]|eukprot:XP_002673589.1 predicted protein [Naegleria gruberi strain NEG-M]